MQGSRSAGQPRGRYRQRSPLLFFSQALTVPLQGFLHSLVYGWLRQNFRQEAVGESPSLQHRWGLKAFYDESLGAVP